MDFTFDIRGNLTPAQAIDGSFQDFETTFVQSFEDSATRLLIFENFKRYINDFQTMITPDFCLWIDGSFVTHKIWLMESLNNNIPSNNYIIADISAQIEALNVVILRHKNNPNTAGLAAQYEHLRAQFYEKLKIALADIEIAAELQHLEKAA